MRYRDQNCTFAHVMQELELQFEVWESAKIVIHKIFKSLCITPTQAWLRVWLWNLTIHYILEVGVGLWCSRESLSYSQILPLTIMRGKRRPILVPRVPCYCPVSIHCISLKVAGKMGLHPLVHNKLDWLYWI